MELDFRTLLAMGVFNLCAIALALPWIIGHTTDRSARRAQRSVTLQACAALCLMGATFMPGTRVDWFLTACSLGLTIAAQLTLLYALDGWLGRRRGKWPLLVLLVLTPAGYLLGVSSYAFRVGWSNAGIALAFLIVCVATWWPAPQRPVRSRWRHLLTLALLPLAGITVARGGLGALTDLYPTFQTPHPVNLAFAVLIPLCAIWGAMALLAAWRDEADTQLHEIAQTDPLTQLHNRRGFEAHAQTMLALARRQGTPLSLVMLDLDHFKRINDTYGHAMGDRTLVLFSRVLRQECRNADLSARLGGEEFCLLLPTPAASVAVLDQRLRLRLKACALAELGFEVTFSAGQTSLQADDQYVQALLERADLALYEAKSAGRNCLRGHHPPEENGMAPVRAIDITPI